jgi:hypothetical protein
MNNHHTDIIASAYIRDSLINESVLVNICDSLLNTSGSNFAQLYISVDERDKKKQLVTNPNEMFNAVIHASPPRYGMNMYVGSLKPLGVSLFFSSSSKTIPIELNNIGIEIILKQWKGKTSPEAWLQEFLMTLSEKLSVRYAFACARGEYEYLNIASDETGTRALGRQFQRYLPGLYWLNYYGRECSASFGNIELPKEHAADIQHFREGVIVRLAPKPDLWCTQSYETVRASVKERLGTVFFFDRQRPNATTTPIHFEQ